MFISDPWSRTLSKAHLVDRASAISVRELIPPLAWYHWPVYRPLDAFLLSFELSRCFDKIPVLFHSETIRRSIAFYRVLNFSSSQKLYQAQATDARGARIYKLYFSESSAVNALSRRVSMLRGIGFTGSRSIDSVNILALGWIPERVIIFDSYRETTCHMGISFYRAPLKFVLFNLLLSWNDGVLTYKKFNYNIYFEHFWILYTNVDQIQKSSCVMQVTEKNIF